MGMGIDALQYFIALKIGAEGIVSFDKDFDVLDIPRIDQRKLLKKEKTN